MKIITMVKRFLVWSFVVFVLAMAGCIYSINVPPWVEWDEHDPRLHGQEVIFTEPMEYYFIDMLAWYGTNDVPVRAVLFTPEEAKSAKTAFRGTFLSDATEVEPATRFIITKSFWTKKNWWEAAFSGYSHDVILESSDGEEVISSFYNFEFSNRPNLYELKRIGY